VLVPALPLDVPVLVYPYAPDSLALHVIAETDQLWVTEDGARTWRELPCPEGAGQLKVSADGKDVWLRSGTGFLRLSAGAWVDHPYAGAGRLQEWEPAGAGMLALVRPDEGLGFLSSTGFEPVEGIDAGYLVQLSDGTLTISGQVALTLGVGLGAEREWIAIY
jgi:hypothetical protein